MQVPYSFHISSKRHALTTTTKIAEVSRHNLRLYKSTEYRQEDIEVLRGSDKSILEDVKAIYHKEFDDIVKEFDASQKRSDRKIGDYLTHLSNQSQDIAVEIIIQIGDKEYWKDKTIEEKRQTKALYEAQISELERLCPDFKIASAVLHLDESSPHVHLCGVPIAHGYKRGLSKRVSKTKIFTRESLSMLQDKMREHAQKLLESMSITIKPKEKGRNYDLPKALLADYYKLQEATQELDENLRERNKNLHKLNAQIGKRFEEMHKLDVFEELCDIYKKAYGEYFELELLEREREKNKSFGHERNF